MRYLFTILLLFVAVSSSLADDEENRPDFAGPLGIRSEAVLINHGLAWTPGQFHTLFAGEVEHSLFINHVNMWGPGENYFVDMELTRYSHHFRVGLGEGMELSAQIAKVWRGGGILDGTIEWFHNTFDLAKLQRPNHPPNDVKFTADGVTYLTKRDSGLGLANPVIGFKKELFYMSRIMELPNIALEVQVKLPLGDIKGQRATKGWDFLLDAQIHVPAGRNLSFYSTLGLLVTPGHKVISGIKTRSVQMFFFFGIEIWLGRNAMFELAYTHHEAVTKESRFGALSKGTHEFALGIKWAVAQNLFMEFGIIENSFNDFNTPDFGMHLGITWRVN